MSEVPIVKRTIHVYELASGWYVAADGAGWVEGAWLDPVGCFRKALAVGAVETTDGEYLGGAEPVPSRKYLAQVAPDNNSPYGQQVRAYQVGFRDGTAYARRDRAEGRPG